MLGRRESNLAALLARVPIPLLGLVIAASSVQASCGGVSDTGITDVGKDAQASDGHPSPADGASEDSREDRADGMSYGDGYSP
jgi:hypothetical protein